MSASMSQTPVKESVERTSRHSHKTKKRKHVDEHGEQSSKKKKKHTKSATEQEDEGLLEPEVSVKKRKKKQHRSPPDPTGHLTPTSPSIADAPAPDLTPILIDQDSPQPQTRPDDETILQHSPEPSIPDDTTPSPFHSVRLSIYLPLSAISLSPSTALASVQAEHLAPLLLTYYAPTRGIVLAFTDTTLSTTRPPPAGPTPAPSSSTSPILARCADDYGASYTWLTTTFLVFRPTPTHALTGWINVSSDTFVGLIAYNFFQAGVAKTRIPSDWRWIGPGGDLAPARKRSKRTKIRIRSEDPDGDEDPMDVDIDFDADNDNSAQTTQVVATPTPTAEEEDGAEDDYDGTGYFVTGDGSRAKGNLPFRIVDVDVVPGHDREKWGLQIEGTLLSPEDEAAVVTDERVQAEKLGARGRSLAPRGGVAADVAMMSGALGAEAEGRTRRTASGSQTPVPGSARR